VMDSVAVYVEKGGPQPSASETSSVTLRPRGRGAIVANTLRATGKIQAVDTRNHTVTITGPSGRTATFKVSPSVKNLGKLKAGDDVVIRYTEAMAFAAKKP